MKQIFNGYEFCNGWEIKNLTYITNRYVYIIKISTYINSMYLQCIYLLVFIIIILYINKNIDKLYYFINKIYNICSISDMDNRV
jgi:hypothetical protein